MITLNKDGVIIKKKQRWENKEKRLGKRRKCISNWKIKERKRTIIS